MAGAEQSAASARCAQPAFIVCTNETEESATFFCRIKNVQTDDQLESADPLDVNLSKLEPVIHNGMYHSIGNLLGKTGDFSGQTNPGISGASSAIQNNPTMRMNRNSTI